MINSLHLKAQVIKQLTLFMSPDFIRSFISGIGSKGKSRNAEKPEKIFAQNLKKLDTELLFVFSNSRETSFPLICRELKNDLELIQKQRSVILESIKKINTLVTSRKAGLEKKKDKKRGTLFKHSATVWMSENRTNNLLGWIDEEYVEYYLFWLDERIEAFRSVLNFFVESYKNITVSSETKKLELPHKIGWNNSKTSFEVFFTDLIAKNKITLPDGTVEKEKLFSILTSAFEIVNASNTIKKKARVELQPVPISSKLKWNGSAGSFIKDFNPLMKRTDPVLFVNQRKREPKTAIVNALWHLFSVTYQRGNKTTEYTLDSLQQKFKDSSIESTDL
jgi:hypothetical protein